MARSAEFFLCSRWTALVLVQWRCSHMVFTCSITSTLDIFPNTPPPLKHTRLQKVQLFPRQAHLWSILSPPVLTLEPKMCVFVCVWVIATGRDCLSCPPPPTVWLWQTCVWASGSVSVFFWGDLIMSSERSRVSAMKWSASMVHWAISHCSHCPGPTTLTHPPTSMSTYVPARPDILAFRLVLRQHIAHTSYIPPPSDLVELKRSWLAALLRVRRVTLPGCGSDAGVEQCVLAVTTCLSLFVTCFRAVGRYFLQLFGIGPTVQSQLCISKHPPPASTTFLFRLEIKFKLKLKGVLKGPVLSNSQFRTQIYIICYHI